MERAAAEIEPSTERVLSAVWMTFGAGPPPATATFTASETGETEGCQAHEGDPRRPGQFQYSA